MLVSSTSTYLIPPEKSFRYSNMLYFPMIRSATGNKIYHLGLGSVCEKAAVDVTFPVEAHLENKHIGIAPMRFSCWSINALASSMFPHASP